MRIMKGAADENKLMTCEEENDDKAMTRPQKTEAAKKRSLTLARHFTGYFTSSPFWSYHPSICCHLFAQCSD